MNEFMDFEDVIQVAGIIDQAEADLLANCGVRYLGFPLRLPVHQPDLSEKEAALIIRNLRSPAHAVLITYLRAADEIVEFCNQLGASVVQLHGEIELSELRDIKNLRPDLAIIKSLVVGLHSMEQLLELVESTALYVDAYITDTFDPKTGACGGTGKIHDWDVSRQLIRHSPKPVILAGGLTAENVRVAILTVRPAGVDAHTGLEDALGRKSEEKVRRFVKEAQAAFHMVRTAVK